MRNIIIIALLSIIAGCIPPPFQTDIAATDNGGLPPDSSTVATAVREYYEMRLFDPLSAMYKFAEPAMLWYRGQNDSLYGGWGVVVNLNAKNRLGGYVGWAESLAIFRDDRLKGVYDAQTAAFKQNKFWGWK